MKHYGIFAMRKAAVVIQIFTKLKEVRLVFRKLIEGPKV